MNSGEVSGFSTWTDWSSVTVNRAPKRPGVYVFRLAHARQIGRLKGSSDLVYIGATKKGKRTLRDRLGDHLRSRGDKRDLGWQLERVINEVGALEVAWKEFENHSDARWDERELLAQYANDHIEFPPLNRQETGKQVSDVIRLIPALNNEERAKLRAQGKERQKASRGNGGQA